MKKDGVEINKIKILAQKNIYPCPKCGNEINFEIHKRENLKTKTTWIVCICGYDPKAIIEGHWPPGDTRWSTSVLDQWNKMVLS